MAQKLHRQFAHASTEKLLRLVNSAGSIWSQDSKLKEKSKPICKNCPVCLIYKKTPPRQIVGLTLATKFNKCVTMDLKFYKGKILLQLNDHATSLSVTVILASKKPDQIVNTIMKYWVALYGTVDKFLTDNRDIWWPMRAKLFLWTIRTSKVNFTFMFNLNLKINLKLNFKFIFKIQFHLKINLSFIQSPYAVV